MWPADKELYAVTASGETSTVTVFYDAQGASATEVGIIGPVDVDIVNPVNVQGGGVVLYDDVVVIPANDSVDVVIPGPSSGLTFYGIDVHWEIQLSTATVTASRVRVFVNGASGATSTVDAIPVRTIDPNEIAELGNVEFAIFSTPMKSSFPLTVRVENSQPANTLTGALRVTGTAYALPYPIDSEPRPVHADAHLSNASVGEYVTIAPSFDAQRYRLTMLGDVTGIGDLVVDALNAAGGWVTTELRPHLAYFGGTVSTNGRLEPNTKAEFILPGNGTTHRVRVTGAISGQVILSYAGKAS